MGDADDSKVDDLGGYEEGGSLAETCAVEAEPITQAPVRIVFTAPGDRGTYAVRPPRSPSKASATSRRSVHFMVFVSSLGLLGFQPD